MKRPKYFLLIGLIIACASLSLDSLAQQSDPRQQTVQWEHLALTNKETELTGAFAKQVNDLGDKGWELVCVTPFSKDGSTEKTIYYFKRPK